MAKRRASRRAKAATLRRAFAMTRAQDPKMLPLVAGAALLTFLIVLAIGFLVNHPIYAGILGLLLASAVAAVVFGRRASATAYRQVEGQPGAAVAVLQSLRGDWRVTPMVGFNRQQDMVHRAVGRPGVILLAEGSPQRTAQLIGQEKRRLGRLLGDVPIYDIPVGDGEGQVPLRRLQAHLSKLPRNIKPAQVNAIDARLKAVGGAQLPIPKGPLPRNVRMPKMPPGGGKIR